MSLVFSKPVLTQIPLSQALVDVNRAVIKAIMLHGDSNIATIYYNPGEKYDVVQTEKQVGSLSDYLRSQGVADDRIPPIIVEQSEPTIVYVYLLAMVALLGAISYAIW